VPPLRSDRLVVALAAGACLAGTFVLPPDRPLPIDLCLWHRVTGLPCLTCGLTRATCLFARGLWRESLAMHAAGWLVLSGLAVAAAWTGTEAVAGRDLAGGIKQRLMAACVWGGLGLSVLTWLARLAGSRGSG
jgi:hypothetical protein